MLIDADLPESYWDDALAYATLLYNVLPTSAHEDSESLEQKAFVHMTTSPPPSDVS
jgi:hypothetical protein